ncbi:titin isoform X2 [Lutzomyia longipalpis]|uniref:titin isoform X2 n=1 Tax=Lutzomyia longipalpis TaxID=7200 RepID=UPI002483AFDB|nr:titin isoform X2 [Lutzomyia longipalpis]
MGCANSSPLANGAENIMGTAKSAAHDIKHTGEEVINDVNSKITDTVEYVKDTVVGTMHGMGQDLESALKGGKEENKGDDLMVEDLTESKYIPLKEPNGLMENLEERKTEMMKRVQSLSDEADKMADELIKETEDVITDGVEDVASKVQNGLEGAKDAVEDAVKEIADEVADKTPVHSIDSLKTGTPEPELERILETNEDTKSPSPKPTLMQLEDLEVEPSAPSETKAQDDEH